jgi:hypothetical protein
VSRTLAEKVVGERSNSAIARFFIRIGQKSRGPWRDEHTLPLFPLPLILEAEGLLAREDEAA